MTEQEMNDKELALMVAIIKLEKYDNLTREEIIKELDIEEDFFNILVGMIEGVVYRLNGEQDE